MDGDHLEDPRGSVPQREPLRFHYDPASVLPEMAPVMEQIKQLAEKLLYHWKEFPIILPPSLTGRGDSTSAEDKDGVNFSELFIAPTFDELEQVALNPAGELKKLSQKQLDSIWDSGEFDVDSINFPGQCHRWRLTQLLQKGSKKAHNTLLDDTALALRLLIITARNRFISHFFSLSESVKSWGKGLWKVMDILIGMPSTSPGELESKVHWEHMLYLVAELSVKSNCKKGFNRFCDFVKEKCQRSSRGRRKSSDFRPPPIPYAYNTPKGLKIDLRLFNKDLINNCLPVLSNILEREAKGWYIQFRQKLLMDLKGQGLSTEELSKRVNEAVMEEYLKRIFDAINSNAELENLQPGIGELLVSQAKAVIAMQKAVLNVQSKMQKHKNDLLMHLNKAYPVKSRITAWVNEKLAAFESEFILRNEWSAHEEAISICEEEGLEQAVYFLRRDLNFIKERESVLVKELSRIKIPNRIFTFSTRIWLPKNWVTFKTVDGEETVVRTQFAANGAVPPVASASYDRDSVSYRVNKYSRRKTSTRYPFWRWWNYLHRTWAWMWNAMFFFGVVVPWCSPLSLRALLYWRPFTPDTDVSRINGLLYPKASSETQTLLSRLNALWTNVRKSRKQFEDAPDRGFLGKSFTRHLNRFWNYVLKGAVGSVLLVLGFPVMCVTVSGLSLVAGVTAPVWIPMVTLVAHLFALLVYDFDRPDEAANRYFIIMEAVIWRFLIQGTFQPVAAILFGCLGCPLAALGISLFGVTRRGGRGLWDTFMYQAVIKSRGRVPAKDGFVARRISGPGLASNYFLQIRPEQALAALEARMEAEELECWKAKTVKIIQEPCDSYRQFVHKCFRPFSADIITEGVYKTLNSETAVYMTDLSNKVSERERRLNIRLHPDEQRKIKLPERELKITILQAAKLLEAFYPEHVIKLVSLSEAEFWENRELEFRDWIGLASRKLSEIFSKNFLVPLEDTDTQFQLEVEHLNLHRYMAMLNNAKFHDDLDLVTEVHTPKGDITTRAPHLDSGYFNPSQKIMYTTRRRTPRKRFYLWKPYINQGDFDKMEIPLPIPHPAVIAISVYNREHDQDQIDFDDIYCLGVIKAAKEIPYVDICDPSESVNHDMDSSTTPENGTDPVNFISHLAEQEHSFSDETNTTSPTSPKWHTPLYEKCVNIFVDDNEEEEEGAGAQEGAGTGARVEMETDKSEREEDVDGERVVYVEQERDSSCVVDMSREEKDDESEEEEYL